MKITLLQYKMLHIFQIAESLNMTVQKLEETQSQVDDIRTSITPVEVGFFFVESNFIHDSSISSQFFFQTRVLRTV